jgi:cytochrome c-type biogenesis protein CcmH
VFPVALLLALVAGAVLLVVWGQSHPPRSLDARVQAVASQLRCPVCQGESVADAPAQLASDMRAIIRQRLQAGETPDQIKAYFVSKYGQWVLLAPPRSGIGGLVWFGPLALGGVGFLLLAALVLRWRRLSLLFALTSKEEKGQPGALTTRSVEHEVANPTAERDVLLLALEQLDDDHDDGVVAQAEYVVKRRALEEQLSVIDTTRTTTATPMSAKRPSWRVASGAVALLAAAAVIAASLSFALQPRGTNAITGNGGLQAGPASGRGANTSLPTDVQRALNRVDAHSRSAAAWVALGAVLVRHQDYLDARNAYTTALHLDAHNASAELGAAFLDIGIGHYHAALPLLSDVEQRHPTMAQPWLLQGLALSHMPNHKQQALVAWHHFLSLAPNSPVSKQVRAWMVALQKQR